MNANGANGHADFIVSVVPDGYDTTTKEASFRSLLADVANGRWKSPVEKVRAAYAIGGKEKAAPLKLALPGILFSGTFKKRGNEAIVLHSGLICADLDQLKDSLESYRDHIVSDPHVLACFRSPTGSGLKVVFRCDPARPHIESYRAIEQYVLATFGLEVDNACKDVSRMCFVSHDPEAFVASDAEQIPYPAAAVEFQPKAKLTPPPAGQLTPGDDYDRRADFSQALLDSGWSPVGKHGWTRPGKNSGVSATWDKVPGRFYVFSSEAAPFEPNHVYRPWHVYALLAHGGDFKQAARALSQQGYGSAQFPVQRATLSEDLDAEPSANGPTPEHRKPKLEARRFSSFTLPLVNDPATLLGDRWLSKGDGAFLVSTSGMGKSSLITQAAFHWALGRDFFGGCKPARPLRTLIMQSEDGDGDVAEVRASLYHAMKLTAQDIEAIDDRTRIVHNTIMRGSEALLELKAHIEEFNPDIVIINPLLAYMEGNINDARDTGAFLRDGLNRLNHPPRFAYIVVHHTSKPPKEKSERQWNEVMYDMAGSADLTNWARAIVSLRPTPTQGQFNLVFTKRGGRADYKRPTEGGTGLHFETVTTIGLKHSKERAVIEGRDLRIIHWEECAMQAEVVPKNKGGRPSIYSFDKLSHAFPKPDDPAQPPNQIYKKVVQGSGISQSAFKDLCVRTADEGFLERVMTPTGPTYRLVHHQTT